MPMTETKVNVLFVDDDAMLRQGLRRMLHPMRNEWAMSFAASGKEALDQLEQLAVDVVVSDMRMPEMDGAELLTRVGQTQPAAIRIVLSGFAENEAIIKTVGASHQYLAKPCDADTLIATIRRSLNLRCHLADTRLKSFVAELASLPALPQTYHDFMAEISNPVASTESIAATIERDVAMTATILRLTNSAYFSLPSKITDCRQAVRLLGLETMRGLVAGAGVFRCYEGAPAVQERLNELCNDSLATAAEARRIAAAAGLSPQDVEHACCGGLLSHVGQLLLLAEHPKCCRKAEDLAHREGLNLLEAERRAIGANHTEVGAYLLSLWGFADPIVEAVLHHHGTSINRHDVTDVLSAVQVAHNTVRGDAQHSGAHTNGKEW